MSVIGSIRKRSGLLVGFIVVAMALFLLSDQIPQWVNGGPEILDLATFNGDPINEAEYNRIADNVVNNTANQSRQRGQEPTERQLQSARVGALQSYITYNAQREQMELAGIVVSEDELDSLMGGAVPSEFLTQYRQSFQQSQLTDAFGNFSLDTLEKRISQLEASEQNQQVVDYLNYLRSIPNQVKENRLGQKFNYYLESGFYVTKLDAKFNQLENNKKKSVRYVYQTYPRANPADEVSEETMKTYYDKHKSDADFKQEEGKRVEYFVHNVTYSPEDEANLIAGLNGVREEILASEDDSAFVRRKSQNPQDYTGIYESAATIGTTTAVLDSMKTGDVTTPFQVLGDYRIVKLMDAKVFPDSVRIVRASLPIQQGALDFQQKQRGDSIVDLIKSGTSFSDAVSQKTTGFISNTDTTWLALASSDYGNQKVFSSAKGGLGVYRGPNEYYVYRVLAAHQATEKRYKVAKITRELKPSKETFDIIRDSLFNVIDGLEDVSDFKSEADSIGYRGYSFDFTYTTGITATAPGLPGELDKLKGWVFNKNTEVGDISAPIKIRDQFVVAKITNDIERGEPNYDLAKVVMKDKAMRYEQYLKYVDSLGQYNNLDEVAEILKGQVQNGEVTLNQSQLASTGFSPELIGLIFAMDDEEMSAPFELDNGVVVVEVIIDNSAEATEEVEATQERLQTGFNGASLSNQWARGVFQSGEVVDNRYKVRYAR